MEKYTIGVVPLTIETKEYCQNWFVSNQVECQIIKEQIYFFICTILMD